MEQYRFLYYHSFLLGYLRFIAFPFLLKQGIGYRERGLF